MIVHFTQFFQTQCLSVIHNIYDVRVFLPGDLSDLDPSVVLAILQKCVSHATMTSETAGTMTTKAISYKSSQKTVSGNASVLETGEKDGINHTWSGYVSSYNQAILTWKFDWEDLKSQGVDRLVGQLIVRSASAYWTPHKIDIDWTETNKSVSAKLGSQTSSYIVTFEYKLTAHYAELQLPEKSSYDKMFAASDMTDAVLIVEGKKLNVNKAFLSIHSDYFKTLFSANFKEGQMKEIEIKEVFYEDFGLLLSSFYPHPQFPNDLTVEKLLEMARRFQVLSVIEIVEHHLLHISRIAYEKMMWLADEHAMPKLLEKCIRQMNSAEKAKILKKTPEFKKLSDKTRLLVFERLLEII
ncbi:hypothetical protein B9Z55_007737 [Caenorhabditis nigoni]|uniref:BTB domain-containing protein n=1 Tax=Caenorhabditis nigoni TaxID=1611254 RepID=A0A2G5VB13_9PELO|nr:hypothetical protein B9Z55_007737 [Caenorhabditis nigoni]